MSSCIDVASGEEICRRETDAPIEVNPIVSDDVAYVSNTGSQVYMFPAGVCNGSGGRAAPIAPT